MRSDFFTSLKSKKRIEQLFTSGRKVFGGKLMLRYAVAAENHPPLAVVFAVSRKMGDAHLRNRAKRRLREALYFLLKEQRVRCAAADLAILPQKAVADCDFAELCRDLESALKKLPKAAA